MHIELVELLRCPRPHEDTWLVATVDRMDDREIVSGVLGCPICRAEYPIRDRIVYFRPPPDLLAEVEPDPAQAMRIAAALGLTERQRIAVLQGDWGIHALFVRAISPAQLIVLDAPIAIEPGEGVNVIMSGTAPFARESVHGVAVDARSSADVVRSLADSLRLGGRMLASSAAALPPGLTEVARDDEVWVAERSRDVIPLRRGARVDD
jgi:uncharacterized protein YbaR (Trm112 family)